MPNPNAPQIFKKLSPGEIKKESETAHTAIWTPATGKRFVLRGFYLLSSLASKAITLEDGTTSTGIVIPIEKLVPVLFNIPGMGFISSTPENKLQIKIGEVTLTEIGGLFWGEEE